MKSLATQAANGTIAAGSDEMSYISSQLEALGDDINDVAKSTSYNGVNLVNEAASLTFQVGEGTSDTMAVSLSEINMATLFQNSINAGDDEAVEATDVLGDTTNGGTTADFATGGTLNHIFYAFDADLADNANIDVDNDASMTGPGASIVVRGKDITGSAYNDKLLIDELTVNAADMRSFLGHIDTAIGTMNGYMNQVGIDQRSLSGKEVNLTEAITANSAAKSRIMDTDFAKEQSNSIRLQILQQTATAALSQANMGPQAVLGFLG
jgi:flagellin